MLIEIERFCGIFSVFVVGAAIPVRECIDLRLHVLAVIPLSKADTTATSLVGHAYDETDVACRGDQCRLAKT